MKTGITERWQAFACMMALPLSAIFIAPHAEAGISDDFAYIRMVKVLAQTGHLVYNGWESAMMGWLIFLGAAVVKVFGFSITVVRGVSTVLGCATAFLVQRTGVRLGLYDWNATLATLTLLLSPLFMPLAFTFMTDIPGLLCLVCCLYLAVRILQAGTDREAVLFLVLTELVSVGGGTCRQTAWLGSIVLIPSLMVLLRRRRPVVISGVLLTVLGWAGIFSIMHWFAHQPFSLAEKPMHPLDREGLHTLSENMVRSVLELPLFVLPVMVAFVGSIRRGNRRANAIVAAALLACLFFALIQMHRHKLELWLPPYLGEWVTTVGAYDGAPIHGAREVILHQRVRLGLAVAMVLSTICFLATWITSPALEPAQTRHGRRPSWHEICWLLLPVTVAYFGLLVPRSVEYTIFDRYLLFPVLVLLLLVARLYQDRVRPQLPVWSFAMVLVFGAYAVATTHDLFSFFRARAAAIEQMQAAHVPALDIDGSAEYDLQAQIDAQGFINDPRVILPPGVARPSPPSPEQMKLCKPIWIHLFPALHPKFALSLDPNACGGLADFAPVSFHPWLGPKTVSVYVVREPR